MPRLIMLVFVCDSILHFGLETNYKLCRNCKSHKLRNLMNPLHVGNKAYKRLAGKHRTNFTRSPKQRYQWPHKKKTSPLKNFKKDSVYNWNLPINQMNPMTKPDCFMEAVIGLFFTIILQKRFLHKLKSLIFYYLSQPQKYPRTNTVHRRII